MLSLSWKGDVRQGWLATGNSRKTVGVTYTEMADEEEGGGDLFGYDGPDFSLERQGMRRNFNFREHSAEVCLQATSYQLTSLCFVGSSAGSCLGRACARASSYNNRHCR